MNQEVTSGIIRLLTVNDVYCDLSVNGRGGYPNLHTMLKKYRKDVEHSIFTVIGDILGGSALTAFFKGEWVVDVLDNLEAEMVCIGNHEFDNGAEVLEKLIAKNRKIKWFGGNIKHTADDSILTGAYSTHVNCYDIKNASTGKIETIRVGFLGVCTEYTPKLSYPGDSVKFEPVIECVRQQVHHLKNEENVDVIVALTHVSLKEDIAIAKAVKGIDVILGGHDHEPHNFYVDQTLIFKAGVSAYWLGVVDLNILVSYINEDENLERKVKVYAGWEMKANIGYEPEESTLKIITGKMAEKKKLEAAENPGEILIPSLPDIINTQTTFVRSNESAMGNLIADGLKDMYKEEGVSIIGLINGGFIRGDRLYKKDEPFTKGSVLFELPFPRPVCPMSLTGAQLKDVIEQHLHILPITSRYPHISFNARVEYDPKADSGSRIQSFILDGKPVIDDDRYVLVVTEFLARGGDNMDCYTKFTRIPIEQKRVANVIIDYLRNCSPAYRPRVEGRMKPI